MILISKQLFQLPHIFLVLLASCSLFHPDKRLDAHEPQFQTRKQVSDQGMSEFIELVLPPSLCAPPVSKRAT